MDIGCAHQSSGEIPCYSAVNPLLFFRILRIWREIREFRVAIEKFPVFFPVILSVRFFLSEI
jgi:hypothetical protein